MFLKILDVVVFDQDYYWFIDEKLIKKLKLKNKQIFFHNSFQIIIFI